MEKNICVLTEYYSTPAFFFLDLINSWGSSAISKYTTLQLRRRYPGLPVHRGLEILHRCLYGQTCRSQAPTNAGTGESKINELRWWLMNINRKPSCNYESIILNMMNPWWLFMNHDNPINGLMIDSGLFCWRGWCFFDLDMLLDWRVWLRGQMLRWNEGCVATNNGRGHYGSSSSS